MLINNDIIFKTPTFGKQHSVTSRQFCFSMPSKQLRIWLVWNRERIKLTFPQKEKYPMPESLSIDLALQPGGTVYLCCRTIRFQCQSLLNRINATEQKPSAVRILRLSSLIRTKGFTQKKSLVDTFLLLQKTATRISGHFSANLTEGFPCLFLSCMANARV
jgi:hypothetical protein